MADVARCVATALRKEVETDQEEWPEASAKQSPPGTTRGA